MGALSHLVPLPSRQGMAYICEQRVAGPDLHRCGARFVFRVSYENHWLAEHKPKPPRPVPSPPQPCGAGQCACPDSHVAWPKDSDAPRRFEEAKAALAQTMERKATLIEIRVEETTNLLHYGPSPHQTGPGCRCGTTELDGVPDDLPTITTKDGHAAPDEGDEPDLVAWTEVDRKEATARLDAHLEHLTVKATGLRITRLDETGQPKMEGKRVLGQWVDEAADFTFPLVPLTIEMQIDDVNPVVVGILSGTHRWNPDAQEYQLAHVVEVTPCPCGFSRCRIAYHECKVCELVTLSPPPLPCPGPRKDTH